MTKTSPASAVSRRSLGDMLTRGDLCHVHANRDGAERCGALLGGAPDLVRLEKRSERVWRVLWSLSDAAGGNLRPRPAAAPAAPVGRFNGPRLVAAILAAAFVLSATAGAAGQRATAGLERIARADVDGRVLPAGPPESMVEGLRAVVVCLDRAGAYVLILDRAAGSFASYGVVAESDASGEPYAYLTLGERDERRWTWTVFTVDGPRCLSVGAAGGRARLYRMSVGVSW